MVLRYIDTSISVPANTSWQTAVDLRRLQPP
jgi:hypothetical protein